MKAALLALASTALATGSLAAQHEEHHASPYAGTASAEVASLTQQEIDDLRSGAGMGLARAAELNHYPGPKHVLEMGMDLGLTDRQRATIERIEREMHAAAVDLGEAIIDAERTLDQRFAHEHIDESALQEMVGGIARLRGELRVTHLRAHLRTTEVLTARQIATYDRMRGYAPRNP